MVFVLLLCGDSRQLQFLGFQQFQVAFLVQLLGGYVQYAGGVFFSGVGGGGKGLLRALCTLQHLSPRISAILFKKSDPERQVIVRRFAYAQELRKSGGCSGKTFQLTIT